MAVTGRFAPSPSGRIHLGNILCCLLAWLSARQKGGRVILRIEDLDIARCPRRYGGADVPGHPVAGTGLGRGTCHRRPQRPL